MKNISTIDQTCLGIRQTGGSIRAGRVSSLFRALLIILFFTGGLSLSEVPPDAMPGDEAGRDEPIKKSAPTKEKEPASSADRPAQPAFSFSIKDIGKLQKTLEKLRGLKFKDEVKSSIKTREDLRKKLIKDFNKETTEEEMEKVRQALVKFGLIPEDLNLRQLILDLLTEQVAGFYDPEAKELYLIKSGPGEKPPGDFAMIEKMFGIPWQNVIAIHELTHSLQDQHFDLLSLPLDSSDNDDLATAIRSLVEGEATFVQYDYIFRRIGLDLALIPGITKQVKIQGPTGMKMMDKAPAYIREGLLFPYIEGFAFVLTVKRERGWEGINQMYQNLPSSTEQILHPKKYLESPPDYPTTIQLPDLANRPDGQAGILPVEEWRELLKNVMGELNIKILIQKFLPTLHPGKVASGWDGDQFIVLSPKINLAPGGEPVQAKAQDPRNGQVGLPAEAPAQAGLILIWFTLWDSNKDAEEFFEAYVHLLTPKYPEAHIAKQAENKILWSVPAAPPTDESLILIERKDNKVLVIETAPEKVLDDLAETIWQNTKTEELKEVKRVKRSKKEEDKKPAAPSDEPAAPSDEPAAPLGGSDN